MSPQQILWEKKENRLVTKNVSNLLEMKVNFPHILADSWGVIRLRAIPIFSYRLLRMEWKNKDARKLETKRDEARQKNRDYRQSYSIWIMHCSHNAIIWLANAWSVDNKISMRCQHLFTCTTLSVRSITWSTSNFSGYMTSVHLLKPQSCGYHLRIKKFIMLSKNKLEGGLNVRERQTYICHEPGHERRNCVGPSPLF